MLRHRSGSSTVRGTSPDRPGQMSRLEGLPIIVVFAALVGLFMATAPEVFLSLPIYRSFLTTVPPILILALGLTLVITAGEIDLSFPSVIAFSGFLLSYCIKDLDQPWLAVPAALIGGALIGWVNGFIVAIIGVPSIIATLATQFFWGGITTVISGGVSYSLRTVDEHLIWHLLVGDIASMPVQAHLGPGHRGGPLVHPQPPPFRRASSCSSATTRASPGWSASRSSGRRSSSSPSWACSAVSPPASSTLENKNFFNTQGQGFLLVALAAVFIGGTSILGGKGTIVGTFFGAFIITMIEAGLVATGIQGFWVRAVEGIVFLSAVIFHLTMDEPGKLAEIRRRLPLLRLRPP